MNDQFDSEKMAKFIKFDKEAKNAVKIGEKYNEEFAIWLGINSNRTKSIINKKRALHISAYCGSHFANDINIPLSRENIDFIRIFADIMVTLGIYLSENPHLKDIPEDFNPDPETEDILLTILENARKDKYPNK